MLRSQTRGSIQQQRSTGTGSTRSGLEKMRTGLTLVPSTRWRSPSENRCSLRPAHLFLTHASFDDAEAAAAMHHAHQVKHAVVIALLAGWDWRVPKLFD